MRVVLLAAVLLALTAHAEPTQRPRATTIADAWRALPSIQGHACPKDDLWFDYGKEGGMRTFFCRTLKVYSWKAFLAAAPVSPFKSGPHKGTRLALNAEHDFGRYDPKFVRWAVDNLVPAATDTALRAATQATYDDQARLLARLYWEVHRAITSDPRWLQHEVIAYLKAADDASVGWDDDAVGLYNDTLGTSDQNWNGHDPNHVRAATTWWLRRTKDGTASTWREGLEKLLVTYDAAWLAAHRTPWPAKLPERQVEPVPEYR